MLCLGEHDGKVLGCLSHFSACFPCHTTGIESQQKCEPLSVSLRHKAQQGQTESVNYIVFKINSTARSHGGAP